MFCISCSSRARSLAASITVFVCALGCDPFTLPLTVDEGGDGYSGGELASLVGSAVGLLELWVIAVKVGLTGAVGLRNDDIEDGGRRAYLCGLS